MPDNDGIRDALDIIKNHQSFQRYSRSPREKVCLAALEALTAFAKGGYGRSYFLFSGVWCLFCIIILPPDHIILKTVNRKKE